MSFNDCFVLFYHLESSYLSTISVSFRTENCCHGFGFSGSSRKCTLYQTLTSHSSRSTRRARLVGSRHSRTRRFPRVLQKLQTLIRLRPWVSSLRLLEPSSSGYRLHLRASCCALAGTPVRLRLIDDFPTARLLFKCFGANKFCDLLMTFTMKPNSFEEFQAL